MAITSADIQNQSFKIERRGYDVDEVDVFLERVASEIDDLNKKNTKYNNETINIKQFEKIAEIYDLLLLLKEKEIQQKEDLEKMIKEKEIQEDKDSVKIEMK